MGILDLKKEETKDFEGRAAKARNIKGGGANRTWGRAQSRKDRGKKVKKITRPSGVGHEKKVFEESP